MTYKNPLTSFSGFFVYFPLTSVNGDINSDGVVNVSDLVLLSKYILADGSLTAEQAENADMNNDKRLDVFDMILIRQAIKVK